MTTNCTLYDWSYLCGILVQERGRREWMCRRKGRSLGGKPQSIFYPVICYSQPFHLLTGNMQGCLYTAQCYVFKTIPKEKSQVQVFTKILTGWFQLLVTFKASSLTYRMPIYRACRNVISPLHWFARNIHVAFPFLSFRWLPRDLQGCLFSLWLWFVFSVYMPSCALSKSVYSVRRSTSSFPLREMDVF